MVSEYYSHTTFVYSSIFNNTKTLMNLNLISYFEAFDIYTMATEAGKKGRYHGAVEFHELLVKQFERNEEIREIRFKYFDDYTITYDRAKYLLKEAIIAHDNVLLNRGMTSKYHSCNSRPYSAKFEEKHFTEIPRNITSILDRGTLFSYKPAERNKRAIAGRQRWTEPYDPNKDTAFFSVYHAAQNSQIDTLCTGKQIRVISYS
mgnify:CR=1 FL=1